MEDIGFANNRQQPSTTDKKTFFSIIPYVKLMFKRLDIC